MLLAAVLSPRAFTPARARSRDMVCSCCGRTKPACVTGRCAVTAEAPLRSACGCHAFSELFGRGLSYDATTPPRALLARVAARRAGCRMRAALSARVLGAPRAAPARAAPRAAPIARRPAARTVQRATVCSSSARALSAAVAEKAAPVAAPVSFGATIQRGETAGAALVIEDVSIGAGDRDLLTDASLRVMPGQRVGLVGECFPGPRLRAILLRAALLRAPRVLTLRPAQGRMAPAKARSSAPCAACAWQTLGALRAPLTSRSHT